MDLYNNKDKPIILLFSIKLYYIYDIFDLLHL